MRAITFYLLVWLNVFATEVLEAARLYFEGSSSALITISQIHHSEQMVYETLGSFPANSQLDLKPGRYLLSTLCSKLEVDLQEDTVINIKLHQIILKKNTSPKIKKLVSAPVQAFCNHALTRTPIPIKNTKDLWWLPDKESKLYIGGKTLQFDGDPSRRKTVLNLYPLFLAPPQKSAEESQSFFIQEVSDNQQTFLFQSRTKRIFWIMPGTYDVQIHATNKRIHIDNQGLFVRLSSLLIHSPSVKPHSTKQLLYEMNQGIFNTNQTYLIFPGSHVIKLINSNIQKSIHVLPNQIITLKLKEIFFQIPDKIPSKIARISLHQHKKPRPLRHAQVGENIYLFEDDIYQYSLSGSRGIFGEIPLAHKGPILVSGIKLNWKWQYIPKLQTEFIKLISLSPPTSGETLDILALESEWIILPPGRYLLSLFHVEAFSRRFSKDWSFSLKPGDFLEHELILYSSTSLDYTGEQSQLSFLEPLE